MSEIRTRLTFEKTGRAVYISHLDLMRLLARAMVRAELPFKHTEGFNPHPYISLARPLALGFEGRAELCDFVLEQPMPNEEIVTRMNSVLPGGVAIISSCSVDAKIKDISYSEYEIHIDCNASKVEALFNGPVIVLKRKKKGPPEPTDITPMVKRLTATDGKVVVLLKDAGDGGLNPSYVADAMLAEGVASGHARIVRTGFFDSSEKPVK